MQQPHVFIIEGTEGYGIGRFILSIREHCRRRSIPIAFLAISEGEFARKLRESGSRVECLGLSRPLGVSGASLMGKVWRYLGHIWLWRKALKAARGVFADGVASLHVSKPNALSLACELAASRQVPVNWMMHNALSRNYPFRLNARYLAQEVHRYHVNVIANSCFTAGTLEPFVRNIKVVHLGVDPSHFVDIAGTREDCSARIPKDATVFGIFARLSPEKGHLTLLKALCAISAELPRWHLLVIGGPLDGAVASAIRQYATQEGVCGQVTFLGPVSDVRPYYHAIDIAVNACPVEGFGYSVLEAIMMSKPVVAVGGGVREIFDVTNFGWVAEGTDVEALRRILLKACASREQWSTIAERARARACEVFTEERTATKYCAATLENLG